MASLVLGVARIAWLGRSATAIEDPTWTRQARALAASIGLARRVKLLRSPGPAMPMTWGFVRPVVLLPQEADSWSAERRRAVLLHELAHVKRHDYLTQLMARAACAIYWFNPLVWWAAAQLRNEREQACDDHVLSTGSRPSEYAGHLLEMARSLRALTSPAGATVAMAQPSQLRQRLLSILDAERDRAIVSRRLAFSAWVLAAAVVLPLALLAPTSPSHAIGAPRRKGHSDVPRVIDLRTLEQLQREMEKGQGLSREDAARARQAVRAFESGRGVGVAAAKAARRTAEAASARDAERQESIRALEQVVEKARQAGAVQGLDAARVREAERALQALENVRPQVFAVDMEALQEALKSAQDGQAMYADALRLAGGSSHFNWNWPGKHSSASIHDNDGHVRIRVGMDDGKIDAESDGEVRFTDDESDIASLARRGYFHLETREGGTRHKLEVDSRDDGTLEHKYWLDGKEHPFDEDARAWLGKTLPEIFRRTGYDSDARAERILKRGGVEALLTEITQIQSDYSKRRYFDALLKHEKLDAATLLRVTRQAGREIGSDYELAELLVGLTRDYTLDAPTTTALVEATKDIQSDYERRRVLDAALDKGSLSVEALDAMLEGSGGIQSDYELAELLIHVGREYPPDRALPAEYVKAARTIQSDYDLSRVLKALVARGPLSPPLLGSLLEAAGGIGSDYEMAELLVAVAERNSLEGPAREPFFAAVRGIHSDYEHGRVLASVVEKRDVSKEVLEAVIRSAPDLDSDYEESQLLVHLLDKHPIDDSLRPALKEALRSIQSPYEHDRVLAALGEKGL
jgi:hypothetical protein